MALAGCRTPITQAPVDANVRIDAGVRYAVPTCTLAYQVLLRELASEDGKPLFDTERFMALDATVQNRRMQLAGSVVGRSLHHGVRDYGRPSATYAPVLLETDGLSWTERDGPTWLFSNVGSVVGLVWFFPTLPASAGAVAWKVPFENSNAGRRTEVKRGTAGLQPLDDGDEPDTPTTFTDAEVRFESSHLESGVRVSEFSVIAAKHHASPPDDPFVSTTDTTYRGTYAVSEAGRILRAHVEARRTNITKHVSATKAQTFIDDSDAKLNLVRACDGPVAPSLEPVLTAEERGKPVDDQIRIEVGQ